jgi:hypothetical protein
MSATPQDRPPTNHRKRLARQGPAIAGEQPKKGGILNALRRSPLVGAGLDLSRPATPGRQS